jgi:hypothetical protein
MDEEIPERILLSPVENLAVGAAGGALETSQQMPLITYKLCLQEGRSLPTTLPAWYRGIVVQAGTVAPITAIQFMVNGLLQSLVRRGEQRELRDGEVVVAAAGAGAISAVVYAPVDLITIQQQKLQLNPIQTVRHVMKEFGFIGLFRGFASCAVREAVYTAGYLGLAPVFTARLTRDVVFFHDKPLAAGVTGACLAGALSAIITHPVDTAKTKIQADIAGTQYPSAISALKQMWKKKGMFKGALPRTVRICGAFFVCMSLRDVATDYKTRHYE